MTSSEELLLKASVFKAFSTNLWSYMIDESVLPSNYNVIYNVDGNVNVFIGRWEVFKCASIMRK